MAVRTEAVHDAFPDAPTDRQLLARVAAGDDRALAVLVARYRPLVRSRARAYFLVGGDRDDVVQEGMIGLYAAIRDFDGTRETSFRAFAEMCIHRQLLNAVKAALRLKHGPLNGYISFSQRVAADEDEQRLLEELLPTGADADPHELLVSAERIRQLQDFVARVLSDLEAEVLRLHLLGHDYLEIALVLQRTSKAIDNALQRVRRKIVVHLRERDEAV